MAENETRRAITIKLLSGGTWRSLLLAVLLLAVVRRSLELGTLANVDALGGTILTLTLLALINATFGFGLGLPRGQLPYPGKAAGTRADVGLRTIWRNPVSRSTQFLAAGFPAADRLRHRHWRFHQCW